MSEVIELAVLLGLFFLCVDLWLIWIVFLRDWGKNDR